MSIFQFKRRNSGGALTVGTTPLVAGAGGIRPGEAVYDGVANVLYIGRGDDGSGNSTSIVSIAGAGAYVLSSLLGATNGVATLDGGGKVPLSQIPASIAGALQYQGVWNAATNSPALASGVGTKGNFYKVSVAGTTALNGNAAWDVGDMVVFDGATWDKLDGPQESVTSVAGRIGAVTVASTDLTDAGATGRSLVQAATATAAKTLLAIAAGDVSGLGALATLATVNLSTLATGTLQAAQAPAHTGDVTSTAGSLALTIAGGVVTNAKLSTVATATIKGRRTAGTGAPEDMTVAQTRALLAIDSRTAIADAATTLTAANVNVQYTSLTAARIVTLAAASAYAAGQEIVIGDSSGSCSATKTLTITRAGTDTINGATTAVIAAAYGQVTLMSDGVSKWTIVATTIPDILDGGEI